jgi:lipopolysaccharide export system protein LptA
MIGMKKFALSLALGGAAGALLAGAPASGQDGLSALRGHNTNSPVDVAADRIEVQTRSDRAVFSGNVVARQSNLTLNAARVTVAYTDGGGTQIQRIDATGGVTVRSPSETARGQYAIYDINSRLITMIGGVTLTRGESEVRGGRLVLDLTSGRAVMDGGGPAQRGAPPGTTTAPSGRVTGTFTVAQRPQGQQ